MEGQQPVERELGPARPLLLWASGVTVAWLVLTERFVDLVPAVAAFAGAAWVFGLERRSGRR